MKRFDIIQKIGQKYLKSNIENDEFSYKKVLKTKYKKVYRARLEKRI